MYKVQSGESNSNMKEMKAIMQGTPQFANSAEPPTFNQFGRDAYSKQANSLSMMRKQPNYNPYSNKYHSGWRDHPNFSWSQGSQQHGTIA